jgi:hypothetical protein
MLWQAAASDGYDRLVLAVPLPDRDPERRRPELPRWPFVDPVPEAPGRLALFFAPLEPRPEV